MRDSHDTIRAPQDALGWSAFDGFIYDRQVLTDRLAAGGYIHMVGDDGRLHGVLPQDRAPLAAVLRLEGDLAQVVERIGDLGEQLAGLDTGEAVDISEQRTRITALATRVQRLDDELSGLHVRLTGIAEHAVDALARRTVDW